MMVSTRSVLFLSLLLIPVAATAQEAPPDPCSAPEVSQFDFWLGEWELSWEGGAGTNRIERVLGGCVVQESFTGDMGDGTIFRGMSHSIWDPRAGLWRQTWVDNQGGYLVLTGGMEGNEMILSLERETPQGPRTMRMVFRDIAEDSFDWDWQSSDDGGATWATRWSIHYRRAE